MNEIANNNTSSIAKVNYILQIVSTLIGITGIIAVIIAYVNKDNTAYEGTCPKCFKKVRIKIGKEGSNNRFFKAY